MATRAKEQLQYLQDVPKHLLKITHVLCKAIRQKKVIRFYYESTTSNHKAWRTVEPYMVAIRNLNGNIFFTGWYLPDDPHKEQADQKQYTLSEIDISKLEVLSKTFDRVKIDHSKITDTPSIEVICKVSLD